MQFTDLLDEYIELKEKFESEHLGCAGVYRYHEIKDELNKRFRGEL